MVEIREQIQPVIGVEGGVRPSVEVAPQVERTISTQEQTSQVANVRPLETHPVGNQIQAQIEAGAVGKDQPDPDASAANGSTWSRLLLSKQHGADIVE